MLFIKTEEFDAKKVWKLSNFFLWFYRLLGLTFGGVDLQKGEVVFSEFWNRFGYFWAVFHSLGCLLEFYFFISDVLFHPLVWNHFITYTALYIVSIITIQLFINLWFIQRNGFEMAKNFPLHKIQSKTTGISLIIIWFLHIISPYLMLIYELNGSYDKQSRKTIFLILGAIFRFPIYWSYLFLTWLVTVSLVEELKVWRKRLEVDKRPQTLHEIRLAYVNARNKLIDLDNKVKYNQVLSTLIAVISVMVMIYVICVAENIPQTKFLKGLFLYHMISFVVQLNANCLICGLLYDESNKLLATLDSIDIKYDIDSKVFREALLFMCLSREQKFGFTIGGFMPLKKTSLLSIYSLILTYTVILFQTKPLDIIN